MNIALKLFVPECLCAFFFFFFFNYKRMHFHIFMVCEILGMTLVSNLHKNFLSPFYENYNKRGHGHLR